MTVTICFVIPLIEMETECELILLFVLFYINLFTQQQQ